MTTSSSHMFFTCLGAYLTRAECEESHIAARMQAVIELFNYCRNHKSMLQADPGLATGLRKMIQKMRELCENIEGPEREPPSLVMGILYQKEPPLMIVMREQTNRASDRLEKTLDDLHL